MDWLRYVLAIVILVATGCTRPCKEASIFVTLSYTSSTMSAASVAVTVTDGMATQHVNLARDTASNNDSIEIDFHPAYPMGSTVAIEVDATRDGSLIGFGSATVFLDTSCKTLDIAINAPAETQPPTVVSTNPADGGNFASTIAPIEFVFSEAIAPMSVSTASLQVQFDGKTIEGTISVSDSTVRWTPLTKLAVGRYTATISNARDLAGNVLGSPYTFNFVVSDWFGPTLLENASGNVGPPVLAVDADQRIWAAWYQFPASGAADLWVRRYDAGVWQIPELISISASDPQIVGAVAGGPVWVIYCPNGGSTGSQVWARKWDGTNWAAPVRIDNASGNAYANRPSAGMDLAGNIYVTYYLAETGLNRYDIYTVRYTPGGGWGTAVPLENSTDTAIASTIAVSANGIATAAWTRQSNGTYHVWAARYNPGSGWTTGTQLDSSTNSIYDFEVVADASGRGMVAWTQYTNPASSIQATLTSGSTFPAPSTIATGVSQSLKVVMNGAGQAIVGYQKQIGSAYMPYTNMYLPASGWQGETKVSTGSAYSPFAMALDPRGNAMLVRPEIGLSSSADAVASYKAFGQPWAPLVLLENAAGPVSYPALTMTLSGLAIAVWQQKSNSTTDLFYSIRP